MAHVTDCTNILLSFLDDVGEEYTDNFIFPSDSTDEFNTVEESFETDDFLVDFIDIEPDVPQNTTPYSPCEAKSSSCFSGVLSTPSRDEEEFQQCLDFLDFGNVDCHNAEDIFGPSGSIQVDGFLSSLAMEQEKRKPDKVGQKRSRSPSTNNDNGDSEVSTYKKSRANLNKTISSVCGMLKQYRAQRAAENSSKKAGKRFRCDESIALATTYLQALFGNKPAVPHELLKMSSSRSTLECKALSSMVESSQSKKAKAKLSAWMPAMSNNNQVNLFPFSHTGIGQIAAASRAFNAGMNDLLTPSVVSKLGFDVNIPSSSAITSKSGDKLSSPFTWSTKGLKAMGYPKELEFHGLIRASFGDEGITYCNVEFDACKVIRDKYEHDMFIEETSPRGVTSLIC